MRPFRINGIEWHVGVVSPLDTRLIDRTGRRTLGTTDPATRSVYLSSELSGDAVDTVLLHEIGHCLIISYGLEPFLSAIARPSMWQIAEEWLCNYVPDYGREIVTAAETSLGRGIYDRR